MSNYWTQLRHRKISRRTMLGASAKAGVGAAGLALVGCGGDDDDDDSTAAQAPAEAQAEAQAEAAAEEPAEQAEAQAEPEEEAEAQAAATGPRRGGISFTAWVDSLFTGWDPHTSLSGGDNLGFLNFVYDRVLGFNDDASWKGELAESVEIPDDLTYIFNMRPGAIFHDGAPVDANAMQINMERIRDASDAAGGTRNADGIARAVSMGPVDDAAWRMENSEPFGPTLAAFQAFPGTGMLVSPDKFDIALTDPVGAGAAKYVSYAEGDRFVGERWDGYWDNANVWLDGMERVVIPDINTSWTAFLDGEFDMAEPPGGATAELKAELEADGYVVADGPDQTWTWNSYNLNPNAEGFNVFRDPRLRRAVHLIIDRQAVVDVAFRGLGEPSRGPTSNTSWALTKDYYGDSPNLDEAKQLMDAAGYADGITGTQLSWSLDIHRAQTEVVHAQLAAAGVDMEFVHGSETSIIDRWLGVADWSIATLTWESPFDPDPVLRQFTGGVLGGAHLGGATLEDNPNDAMLQGLAETTDLIDKAAAVATQEARIPLYDDLFTVYQEHGWMHHILQRPKAMAAQSHVQDFRLVPFFAFPEGMGFKNIWYDNV